MIDTWAKPPLHVTDKKLGNVNEVLAKLARHHQVPRKDKERDGEHWETLRRRIEPLRNDCHRLAIRPKRNACRTDHRLGHGHRENEKEGENPDQEFDHCFLT